MEHNVVLEFVYMNTCGSYRKCKKYLPTKAAAWAKPSQGQAVFDGLGLAWVLRKPKPAQAKPKPRLSGQAGPEQH